MQTIKEYELDNQWRVTFTPEYPDDEDDENTGYYVTTIAIESMNGNKYEPQLEGQIKRDGCCDLGFNKPVMWHLCGPDDTTLLARIFVDAMVIMKGKSPLDLEVGTHEVNGISFDVLTP